MRLHPDDVDMHSYDWLEFVGSASLTTVEKRSRKVSIYILWCSVMAAKQLIAIANLDTCLYNVPPDQPCK